MSEPKSNRRARHAVKEHLPRWMLDLTAEADEILAASPYVTEGRLFKKCDPKRAHLYTAFTALSFISGASSLRILKELLSKGVAIYNVDFLHAKVVMINGEHFSLGSQNLTVRGRRTNVEASFVGGGDTPPLEVIKFFEKIHKAARLITEQDIVEMENLIGLWIKKFKGIDQAAASIDVAVAEARRMREQERLRELARQKALAEARKQHQQDQMRRAITKASNLFDKSRNSRRIVATVKRLENVSSDGWTSTSTKSLVPEGKGDFVDLISTSGALPRRLSRYLMINLDNGKLAYARLARSRITYFASGLSPAEKFSFQSHTFKVRIQFERDLELLKARNVVVELVEDEIGQGVVGSVDFAFSIDGLEIHRVHVEFRYGSSATALTHHDVECALRSESLGKFVSLWLTKQFKYKANLYGENAAQYLGTEQSSRFEIKAICFEGKVILSNREYPYRKRPVLPLDLLR